MCAGAQVRMCVSAIVPIVILNEVKNLFQHPSRKSGWKLLKGLWPELKKTSKSGGNSVETTDNIHHEAGASRLQRN